MLSEKFSLLDLTDLALKMPGGGSVDFNMLHTVLSNLILTLGLDDHKVACHIEDEVLAEAVLTKIRLELSRSRRPTNGSPAAAETEPSAAKERSATGIDVRQKKVAYKSELEDLKENTKRNIKEIQKLIREVEDSSAKKEDFTDLVARVEHLEDVKVSREELGRLLEPGFIDSFLDEQLNLRTETNDLKEKVTDIEDSLGSLKATIETDVTKVMKEKFEEVHSMLDKINAKLSLLDPDEINDSFAKLEEQIEVILRELGEVKSSVEQLKKEEKIIFQKISNVDELLNRLEQTKTDKSKFNELVEKKADVDLIMGKVNKRDFDIVVDKMKKDFERLAINVKINEEEMNQGFTDTRQDLALKMYSEDFKALTQPIRNRIKALMYELEEVKKIALTQLFPDAPGIAKCMSCSRGANMAGPLPPINHDRLPPIDLDSVPTPPLDKPREKDPEKVQRLLAEARPNIGLKYEMRRFTIDRKLDAFFQKNPNRSVDGQHTRTLPQQRGLSFTELKQGTSSAVPKANQGKPSKPDDEKNRWKF